MKIETFAVCYNEEKMLPYFLRHYLQYGSVTIFDNHSTDRSVEIAQTMGAVVIEYDSDNKFREDTLIHLKNICWKESEADWVIIVDIDEFVYHRNLLWILERTEGTVIMPKMFEMFSEIFPTTPVQIYDEVRVGIEMKSKMCLFRPDQITEMDYDCGAHFAHPKGNFILNVRTEIIALHFKYLSLEYIASKYAELNVRRSEEDKQRGWSSHMERTREELQKEFEIMKYGLMKIV